MQRAVRWSCGLVSSKCWYQDPVHRPRGQERKQVKKELALCEPILVVFDCSEAENIELVTETLLSKNATGSAPLRCDDRSDEASFAPAAKLDMKRHGPYEVGRVC